jgi:two-component system chemotaxis sensor kinase CheA
VLTVQSDLLLKRESFAKLDAVFMHLIKNSYDHGIEEINDRIHKSKSEVGNIQLQIKEHKESFILTLSDDGAGVDHNQIKTKALELDIYTEEELQKLTEKELNEILFASDFSTKEEVTNLSGRGVGLDAVREELILLGGDITIDSENDKGCSFIIKLPKEVLC